MCVSVYIWVCVTLHVCVSVYVWVYVCECVWVCVYVCMSVYMSVWVYVSVYVYCVRVCLSVYVICECACECVCVCVWTHLWKSEEDLWLSVPSYHVGTRDWTQVVSFSSRYLWLSSWSDGYSLFGFLIFQQYSLRLKLSKQNKMGRRKDHQQHQAWDSYWEQLCL